MKNNLIITFDQKYGIVMEIPEGIKDRKRFRRDACQKLAECLFENSAYRYDEELLPYKRGIKYYFWLLTQNKTNINFPRLGNGG